MSVTFDKDLPMLGQRFPFGKHVYVAVEGAGCELPDCVVDQVIWVRVEP